MRVILTTTEHMSNETYAFICNGFQRHFGEAEFTHIIDNAIIGGFIADVSGQIYDVSIASQLAKMHKEILE